MDNPRLKDDYYETIRPALMERVSMTNPMEAPKLEKVVVNMGVGKATENRKFLEDAARDLGSLTGQKPSITIARRSVSAA